MKSRPLWQISVSTAREAEEAVGALLERLFGQIASLYTPEDESTSTATVYSAQPAGQIRSKRDALDAGLQFIASCGLNLGQVKVLIRKVPREDWTTSWKKYFKTIEIGRALLIRPSWSKRQPRAGQSVIVLDPGLSFGTGQHPTTSFCLRQLVQARKSGQAQSFLDIGTGSGILAIAAGKLGYAPVRAVDNDPVAVRVAKANARRNRVLDHISIGRQDLTAFRVRSRAKFDVICANLIQDLLIDHAERILTRLAPGGTLIVAGLLFSQFAAVEAVYKAKGLNLLVTRAEREWKSGAFRSPA